MQEKYIVTSSGTKNGKPYATLTQITQGTKANGDRYCFTNDQKTVREEQELPVGTIVEYTLTRTAPKA